MKTKTVLIVLACVLAAAFGLGAAGLIQLGGSDEAATSEEDRLIGVFVTPQPLSLFDFGSYVEENPEKLFSSSISILQEDYKAYAGRLYATLRQVTYTDTETGRPTTSSEYFFDEVEGYRFFCAEFTDENGSYTGTCSDEALSDVNPTVHYSDAGSSTEMEGTIYLCQPQGEGHFYFNPVYQQPDGAVYTTEGEGMFFGGDLTPGMSGSHEITATRSVTAGETAETVTSRYKVTVARINTPAAVRILCYDAQNTLLSTDEYAPGTLPERFTPAAGSAYLMVETAATGDAAPTRALFHPTEESLSAFSCRPDGIAIRQYCTVAWPQGNTPT